MLDLLGDTKGVALITRSRELSHEELRRLASKITDPIPARSLVLLVATNTIEAVAGYVGFLEKGIVPLLVGAKTTPEQIAGLVDLYQPDYAWIPADMPGQQYDLYDYPGTEEKGLSYRLIHYNRLTANGLHPDLAALLTTSGSTGSPKLVRLSYGNIEANARSIIASLAITSRDRAITTLPFSYSYGLSILNSHLLAGASIILTEESLVNRGFWDLLRQKSATTFGGVPYHYTLLKQLHFERMDTDSLRYITQAGGRLGDELHGWFAQVCMDKGIDFVVMYGQTEATARMAYLPAEMSLTKIGSVGIAIPGGRFQIIDEQGNPVSAAHVEGELIYTGDNVSMGRAISRDDLRAGDLLAGKLETGDLACFDDEGYLYITGRKKRFLKLFGNRVSLDEVEQLLMRRGFTAACSGKDDGLVAYVESGGESTADLSTIDTIPPLLTSELGINSNAFSVILIERIPRNSAGKILYSRLDGTDGAQFDETDGETHEA